MPLDLLGRREGHRFLRRKLDVASKVTSPISRAVWPEPPPSSPTPTRTPTDEYRRSHLFGASASTDGVALPQIPTRPDPDRELIRRRQQRYRGQLDRQIKARSDRESASREGVTGGVGYDGGLFEQLGRRQQPCSSRQFCDDLNKQIRMKELRLEAEYEAGLADDAKVDADAFYRRADPGLDDDDGPSGRFNRRSVQGLGLRSEAPSATDRALSSRPITNRTVAETASDRHRRLLDDSSERLDAIVLDFLERPVDV